MKDWTIMVYMAGDNNLSTEMVYALEELKSARNENADLFVYFDGLSSDVPTMYCDFSDPNNPVNFYQSHKIEKKLINVDAEFNENSASVNNIINFIDWVVRRYPEEARLKKKYAFVFSGHSIGFLNWGLFKDAKADSYMTHPELRYMFQRVTSDQAALDRRAKDDEQKNSEQGTRNTKENQTKVVLGKKFDLLGFDSCTMSSLEIGYQFQEFASYMVASEGSIPTSGWNYAEILMGRLKSESNTEPKEVAISFVEEFIKQQNKFALADISVDISAWDLGVLEKRVKPAFLTFVDALDSCFSNNGTDFLFHQMRRVITYVHWTCQTYMLEQNIDLVDFCELLVQEIDLQNGEYPPEAIEPMHKVKDACQELIESIRECVLLTGFSGGDFQFSNGISLFFPWSLSSLESAIHDYERLVFVRSEDAGRKWKEFLEKYLGKVTFRTAPKVSQMPINTIADSTRFVYESYTSAYPLDDEMSSASFEKTTSERQPPNSGRQPPNSGRQPPNSGRMIDDMSVFLHRFMKLKNYEFRWNRAGFTSKHVRFSQGGESRNDQTSSGRQTVLEISHSRQVKHNIDLFLKRLSENEMINASGEKDVQVLHRMLSDLEEPTIEGLLSNLEASDIESSDHLLHTGLLKAIESSSIADELKAEYLDDLKALMTSI